MLYWGFDLGDGESAVARVSGEGLGAPEVVTIDGRQVVITAWAGRKSGGAGIWGRAARSAAAAIRSAARFKSRYLDQSSDSGGLLRDFSAKILETLRREGTLVGGDKLNSFYIGCPAGWDKSVRAQYQLLFENLGVPAPHVISESRAVMVGAIQSNSLRDYVDLRTKSVLVIDIGSSTTDFAYVTDGHEAEIRTGGEVKLGGGIMDEVLLEACVGESPDTSAIREVFAESESWRVECELHARALKERYFSESAEYWMRHRCVDSLLITYDKPVMLDLFLDEKMARRLTDQPCRQLSGKSFHEVFCAGLREVRDSIGEKQPELLFLTGGVSRMAVIADWCREVFPQAVIYSDREPEFSVARGLAWCGRIDDELGRFREEVAQLIHSSAVERIVSAHLPALYQGVLDQLLDPILEHAVWPALLDWREGKIRTLAETETVLQEKIKLYLYSKDAKDQLYAPVSAFVREVADELQVHTSEICRTYRLPDHALEISSQLAASDLSVLEKLEARDVLSSSGFTGAAVFAESIISVLVGLMCGGSGVVLITEGPVGIAIGIVSSLLLFAVAHVLGKDAMDQKIREADLPLFVRRLALARPLPKLEAPGFSLPNPLKWLKDGEAEEPAKAAKFRLLPRLSRKGNEEIPERRLRAIRAKVRAGYDRALNNGDSEELSRLNDRLCREITEQIEQRLRELAEQVEIPL